MKKSNGLTSAETTPYPHRTQTLNEHFSPLNTGNSPLDNANLFVNLTRRVADVPGFHNNKQSAGASGTRSHVTAVDGSKMQADPGENVVPEKPDAGFPTPPPTPKKLLANGKPAFPLFESLLRESVDDQLKQSPQSVPSTAPILINTSKPHASSDVRIYSQKKSNPLFLTKDHSLGGGGSSRFDDMDVKESERIASNDRSVEEVKTEDKRTEKDEYIQPITLQDPPKPKLKRQLSIGTEEKTERERLPKRTYIPQSIPFPRSACAEQTWTSYLDPKPDEVDGESKKTSGPPVEVNYPTAVNKRTHGVSEPLQSPHYFNLKEIELTSPFLNSRSRRSREKDDSIFVFPETSDDRRSPTKQSPAKSGENIDFSTTSKRYSAQLDPMQNIGSTTTNLVQRTPAYSQRSETAADASRTTYVAKAYKEVPKYVTHEGFKWPVAATMTDPAPFSPRIVTASPRSTCLQSTDIKDHSAKQSEDIEALQERIKLLEREYARAKEIYMPDTFFQFSPASRELRDILRRNAHRSISDIERSPNEKELRRVEEEVRNRYERSVSDPTYSPRYRYQNFVQKPSPLGRQDSCRPDAVDHELRDYQTSTHPHKDRWQEPWQSDVRRQLFAREELHPAYDPLPTPTPESVFLEDIQLPDEVAKFFHSKSFHPEDLENLKGILRRSQDHQRSMLADRFGQAGPPLTSDSKPTQRLRGEMMSENQESLSRQHALPEGLFPFERQTDTDALRRLFTSFEDMRQYFRSSHFLTSTYESAGRPTGVHAVKRGRKIGDIDVKISCVGVTEKVRQAKEILKDLEHNTENCKCTQFEQEILTRTNEAFARIRRMDSTEESFMRFTEELNETNTEVYKSLEILCGIKCMCKYGRTLDEIYSGSVVYRLNCPNLYALEDLWESYKSGELEKLVTSMFVTQEVKDKFNAIEIKLKVTVSWEEYKQCKHELEMTESGLISGKLLLRSPCKVSSPSQVIHCRSRSEPTVNCLSTGSQQLHKPPMSPFRERICSDSTVELSPRRAFQEINIERDTTRLSVSPSKKSLLENVFADYDPKRSPKLSPMRKSFGIKPPWEHENIQPENRSKTDSPKHRKSDV